MQDWCWPWASDELALFCGLPPCFPTGHSLGGAVATLCTIRLLSTLPKHLHHTVACIGFATPPVGNARLAEAVEAAGWEDCITNYALPGVLLPYSPLPAAKLCHARCVAAMSPNLLGTRCLIEGR
jgi:hypothetical protein